MSPPPAESLLSAPVHPLAGRWRLPLILLAMGLLTLTGLALGSWLGYQAGLRAIGVSKTDIDRMKRENVTYRQQQDIYRTTMSNAIRERDLATSNSTGLRLEVESLQRKLASTAAQITLYESQLAERGGLDLTINSLDIRPLEDNAFEYHLSIAGLTGSRRDLAGKAALRLGRGDELLEIPMTTDTFTVNGIAELRGRWRMPSGFSPQFIQVMIKSADGQQEDIQRFAWERGAPVEEMPTLPEYDDSLTEEPDDDAASDVAATASKRQDSKSRSEPGQGEAPQGQGKTVQAKAPQEEAPQEEAPQEKTAQEKTAKNAA